MTSPPLSTSPTLVDEVLIGYLYERLVFEIILQLNTKDWNDFQPIELSSKFAYIAHYYQELALKETSREAGQAILRLQLNTISGVVNYITNYRHYYKILPEHIAKGICLEEESGEKLPTVMSVPPFVAKDIVEARRRFATIVPEPYKGEVEFLAGLLRRNGFFEGREKVAPMCQGFLIDVGRNKVNEAFKDHLADKEAQREARASDPVLRRKEQELIDAIKELTQMDVEVLCSSSKGINFSDYDLELLLVEPTTRPTPPSKIKPVDSPQELLDRITKVEYDTIQPRRRYFEGEKCVNPQSICFLDFRSNLTCQVSLKHTAGQSIRDLLQAYSDIDEKVEPFIFIVQQTLNRYGRTRETLNNLAVAMIAIDFLQQQKILPNLLHCQGKRANFNFYSGPVEGRLPLEESASRDNDDLAKVLLDVTGNSSSKGRKKGGKESSSPTTTSSQRKHVHGVAGGLNVKGFLEELLGCCRLVNYSFDKELARKFKLSDKPLDLSSDENFLKGLVTCMTPYGLAIEFFEYASKKFKDWDDLLPPPAESLASTAGVTDRDKLFSGLVVQDPFLSDRNLTTLTTGWRFKSISRVFQMASACLSSQRGTLLNEIRMTLIDTDTDPKEEARQIESAQAQIKAIIGLRDEYGDFASGPSIDELAKGFLMCYAKEVHRVRRKGPRNLK